MDTEAGQGIDAQIKETVPLGDLQNQRRLMTSIVPFS